MKVTEFIENLKEFQTKLIEHKNLYLYGNSFPKYVGGMYPVHNLKELEKQSLWLNRWWGENQSILNKFRDSTTVQSPSTGNEWDYTNSALGLHDIAPNKSQSLKKMIAEIERIIGRLTSINLDIELNDDLNIYKKEEKNNERIIRENVFIIHGKDEARWRELKDIIKDDFNLKPIILSEQPDTGATIIEKFEKYAQSCFCAIAIFTPDDEVMSDNIKYLQARPNVIYEIGWFCGKIGRDKVILLLKEGTTIFSDFGGIIQKRFKENIAEKVSEIRKDLEQMKL